MSESDAVTVLHSHNRRLAKRITPDAITDYDNAHRLDVYPVPVAGLDDIGALLVRLIAAPRCCAIRGELIEPDNRRGIRRLQYDDDDGDRATFRDVPRRWLALDCEAIE